MLCKTTMRAALAPVIGLIGVLLAGTAMAEFDITHTNPAMRGAAIKIASETLNSDHKVDILKIPHYRLGASPTELSIKASTDILLTAEDRFVRYDLAGAAFIEAAPTDDLTVEGGSVTDLVYGGGVGQDFVVFRKDAAEMPLGNDFTWDLSGTSDGDASVLADTDFDTILGVRGSATVTVKVAVYSSIGDARAEREAVWNAGPHPIVTVGSAVSGKIEAMVDEADVATTVEDGGPFRRFVSGGMGGKDSGVLAKTTVSVDTKYRDAVTTAAITDAIVTSVTATATSDAGNFAIVAAADGGVIKSSATADPTRAKNNPKPWMVSSSVDCMDGPLTLAVKDGTIGKYDADPDGDGPRGKGDLTPAGIAAANQASGSAGVKVGTGYFCVLAKGNENAIPAVGNPDTKNAYMLTLAPQIGSKNPVKPAAIGPMAAGAIKRNGTTVNLTYLSTHEAYNQRLVIVNRGSEPARYFVNDTSFQLEDGTTLVAGSNELEGMVPGNGRTVIRVQDAVDFEGMSRGAATLNVVAPVRDIDVMTLQIHPGTGQIDTTMYEVK